MKKAIDEIIKKFGSTTPIQEKAIPNILSRKNTLILAPTGSGKTEAALLPVLEKIQGEKNPINALYITPLRALNRDLERRFLDWCNIFGVKRAVRHGDTGKAERAKQSRDPPNVMLTTIEMAQAIITGKNLREHLKNLEFVIVDEVHNVLESKRGVQLSLFLERLRELSGRFTTIGMTATIGKKSEASDLLFGEREFKTAEWTYEKGIKISVDFIKETDKRIKKMLETASKEKCIIFTNTRSTAEELSVRMSSEKVGIHHGSLSKESREEAEDGFRTGRITSIIATSSLELGIDLDIDSVIQYGSPRTPSRILQRIGRSGHTIGGSPKGTIFPTDEEDSCEAEAVASFARKGKVEEMRYQRCAKDVIAVQALGACIDSGRASIERIHKVLSRSKAYGITIGDLERIIMELSSNRLVYYNYKTDRTVRITPKGRMHYFSYLSTIPKEIRFKVIDESGKMVATLDERFASELEEGEVFVLRGRCWELVSIEDDKVLVHPAEQTKVSVPSWAGEDIPVPYEIAQECCKLRKKKGLKPEMNPDEIVVESIKTASEGLVVTHACFGTKANRTIGRILTMRVGERIRENIRMYADGYRVMLIIPFYIEAKHISKEILGIKNPEEEIKKALEGSNLLKIRLTHTSRMLGSLDDGAVIGRRLMRFMKRTVAYEEAVRECMFRDLDIRRTKEIIEKIKCGEIKIREMDSDKPSEIAEIGIKRTSSGEQLSFLSRNHLVSAFKRELAMKTIELKCTQCENERTVSGIPSTEIKCLYCGSRSLGLTRKGKIDVESVPLIENSGKKAVSALATYGIGPRAAKRILSSYFKNDDEFYWALIMERKKFIKNKKYWTV